MIFSLAAIFSTSICKNPQQRNCLLLEERNDFVVKHICSSDRVLTIIQLSHSHFRIGIDKGLLIDSTYALDVANVVGVLGTQIAGMFSLDFSASFPLFPLTLHGDHLRFGKNDSFLSDFGFQRS